MEFHYELDLLRTTDGRTRNESVDVSTSLPKDDELAETFSRLAVSDLKKKIRDKFKIPECVQELSFETQSLTDGVTLKDSPMRDGDTIKVSYTWEGDCEEVLEVVKWLKSIQGYLEVMEEHQRGKLSRNVTIFIFDGLSTYLLEKLRIQYFYPWMNSRTYVNKLHFIACDGLKVTMGVFQLILQQSWKEIHYLLQILACEILHMLWNMCETVEIKRLILSYTECFKLFLQCVMLEKVEDIKGKYGGFSNSHVPHDSEENISMETMIGSLGLLCNLGELPECQMDMATFPGYLEQLSCIYEAPHVQCFNVQIVATLFFQLAYTPETHPLLASSLILQRLLDASDRELWIRSKEHMMPRYFIQVFLSQIILVSSKHIPDELKAKIHRYMVGFFKTASYEVLRERDREQQYVWSIFVPLVKLLYIPPPKRAGSCEEATDDSLMMELHILSLRSVLWALKIMLSRDNHRKLLFKEKLEDYITCAPFYLPNSVKELGLELVKIVGSEPPSLVNIVRSKLAAVHYGLMPILERSVHDIATELVK